MNLQFEDGRSEDDRLRGGGPVASHLAANLADTAAFVSFVNCNDSRIFLTVLRSVASSRRPSARQDSMREQTASRSAVASMERHQASDIER